MKFQIDHDYHIHSKLSSCSSDPEQTPENLLRYAEENGLKEIVLTDHFWDPAAGTPILDWYLSQTYEYVKQSLPLPQSESVRFYFGGETDLDKYKTLGVTRKTIDEMDFVIIPTTHLHMDGAMIEKGATLQDRAEVYVDRLDAVMRMDLPFDKIGIAHLTCPLLAPATWEDHLTVLDMISDDVYRQLFSVMAKTGVGFELNFNPAKYSETDLPRVLRPYQIAKQVGCKFYLGSDTHHPKDSAGAMKRFQDMVDLLDLQESDKFRFRTDRR